MSDEPETVDFANDPLTVAQRKIAKLEMRLAISEAIALDRLRVLMEFIAIFRKEMHRE